MSYTYPSGGIAIPDGEADDDDAGAPRRLDYSHVIAIGPLEPGRELDEDEDALSETWEFGGWSDIDCGGISRDPSRPDPDDGSHDRVPARRRNLPPEIDALALSRPTGSGQSSGKLHFHEITMVARAVLKPSAPAPCLWCPK